MFKFLVILIALVSSDREPPPKVLRAPSSLAAGVLFLMMVLGCSSPDYDVRPESEVYGHGVVLPERDLGGLTLGASVVVSASDFTGDELEGIIAGIRRWGTATGIPFRIRVSDEREPTEVRVVAHTFEDRKYGGMWDRESLSVWLNMDRLRSKPDLLEWVVVHELGHALGLDHAETGVMQEVASYAEPVVDDAALTVLCSLQTCSEER